MWVYIPSPHPTDVRKFDPDPREGVELLKYDFEWMSFD